MEVKGAEVVPQPSHPVAQVTLQRPPSCTSEHLLEAALRKEMGQSHRLQIII